MTNPSTPPAEETMPEWAEEKDVVYRCEHCKMNRPVTIRHAFIRPTIQEEHMNAWGYPCSCTTLTLQ